MKTIINFCPTGMVTSKSLTEHVPVSPTEIIEQTHEVYEIGITIAHIHARLENEMPSSDINLYQEIFEGIRKYCPDLIICLSTSGRIEPEFEKRSAVIELQPDMCSLTLSSLNFLKSTSVNEPEMINNLFKKMMKYGVNPELECFDMGMINYGKHLLKEYNINHSAYWNLIFGNIAGFQLSFSQIGTALSEIPAGHYVSFGGIGAVQLSANALAISSGCGVRVGLEDNIWFDRHKKIKARNSDLVKRVHDLIRLNENEFMPAKEFGDKGFYNRLKTI